MPELEHPIISYSKKIQGEDMLERIEPKVILHNCTFFFKEGYWALQAF